ncbi:hypothetical protein GLYMA_07G243150v4 [Glycine max]|nr:hypothetical protein GLYMA_07G243150v4 [Glycine max]
MGLTLFLLLYSFILQILAQEPNITANVDGPYLAFRTLLFVMDYLVAIPNGPQWSDSIKTSPTH